MYGTGFKYLFRRDNTMSINSKNMSAENRSQLVAEMRKEEQQRQSGYREQALKLFPHVCARCGREFEGQKIRELTVHHCLLYTSPSPRDS